MLDINVKKIRGTFKIQAAFRHDGASVTALFGRSGAGKTSVINMMAGLLRPDKGYIKINNRCVFDSRKGINVPPEKRRFGYIFQDGRLFPHLSVKANLVYGMNLLTRSKRYVKFDQVVEILGIGRLLKRHPLSLSGGEKQRVAIGRALLTSPELLLMDEPLSSLDAARKHEFLPFISRLPKEFSIPIMYVSHSVTEIMNLADNVVILEEGSQIAVGDVESISLRSDFRRITGELEIDNN